MKVIHKLRMDLARCGCKPIVGAVQGEANTRVLEIDLFNNGIAWEIPEGTTVAVAFMKPDGTKGLYTRLPDDSLAATCSGSTVVATLAPQALTCAGTVLASIVFSDVDGHTLATFPFKITVEVNPAAGEEVSNDYYNPAIPDIYAAYEGLIARIVALEEAPAPEGATASSYILTGIFDQDDKVRLSNFNWDELVAAIKAENYVAIRLSDTDGLWCVEYVLQEYSAEERFAAFSCANQEGVKTIDVFSNGETFYGYRLNKDRFVSFKDAQVLSDEEQNRARKNIDAAPKSYILHGTIDDDDNITLTNYNWDELVAAITSEEHPYVVMRLTTTSEGEVIDFVFSNFYGEEYIVFVHNNGTYLESVELGLYDGVMYGNNLRQFVATNGQELNEDEKSSARVNIGATSVKLLWENPDPDSEFPGQTVTLTDCWKRDAIEIVLFNQASDSLSLINSGLLPLDLIKGDYGEMGLTVKTFAGDMHRSIYCTGDVLHGVDIEFGGCESPSVGGSVDNSLLVPYRIYGISYGVRS